MKESKHLHICQEDKISIKDIRNSLREELDGRVRNFAISYIREILDEEIIELCGLPGKHKKGEMAHRGGSEIGWVLFNGQRTQIKKPRARKNGQEIKLERYRVLQSMDSLGEYISRLMVHGISTRSYDKVLEKAENDLGLSKSTVSRQFVKTSRESLNHLRTRTFEGRTFWALVIDAIKIGGSMVIAALGIDTTGKKHILGVAEGATENSDVCKELLECILDEQRKINFTSKIVAVIDGSKALKKGLTDVFKERVEIHRCYIHKKRNIKAKLNKQFHSEFNRRYETAYNANDFKTAQIDFDKLMVWLKERNLNAAESLSEGLPELLTLHKIEMHPELRKSLYTTNIIESLFSTPRTRISRVKRWRNSTDQIQRWAATHLLEQEKRFQRISHYRLIGEFLENFTGQETEQYKKDSVG